MKKLLPVAALLLAGCAARPAVAPASSASPVRAFATTEDRQRLRDWRKAFTTGLAQARAAGHGPALLAEGSLLQPDAAIGGGIPNGAYRCRVIKLGARQPGLLPFVTYPSFACRVTAAGRNQRLAKLTGSQRPVGVIRRHDQVRSLFLGTLVLGDEQRALAYGVDSERDLAGWVERIGERRWRLIVPYPRFESLMDVVELTPA